MSEQNKVLLDTSQPKAALAELEAAAKRLDSYLANSSAAQAANIAATSRLLQERASAAKEAAAAHERLKAAMASNASAAQAANISATNKLLKERAQVANAAAEAQAALDRATASNTAAAQAANLSATNKLLKERAAAAAQAAQAQAALDKATASNASAAQAANLAATNRLLQERAVAATAAAAAQAALDRTMAANATAAQASNLAATNKLLKERAAATAAAAEAQAALDKAAATNAAAAQAASLATTNKLLHERATAAAAAAAAQDRLNASMAENAARARAANAANEASLLASRRAGTATGGYRAGLSLASDVVRAPSAPAGMAEAAAASAAKAKAASAEAAKEVEKLSKSLETGGARLKDTTNGFTRFTAAQWEAHSAVRGLAGAMGQLWVTYGNLAPLLAGAAVGATIKSAVQAGTEFQYQLTFVKALGGESAEAVKRLSEEAKNLATTGLFGPIEVANGLRILTQAGLDANKAMAVLPSTLDLATVGEMKLEDAAITLAGVMTAFNKEFYEASKVGDVFAKAAAESQVSVMDMTESMKTASVVGQQYGASMEDTATALTLLGQLNIRGSAAGTSLRNMLKELYTPGKAASDMMTTLGLKAYDAQGAIKPFPDVIYELKTSLETFNKASQTNILQTLFGERGAKEAIAMLSQTREEWDRLKTSLSGSDGFMREVAAELEATAKGNLAQAFNTLKVTMIETFESTEGAVGELAMALKAAFGSEEFKATLQALASGVVALTQALMAMAPVLAVLAAGWVALKAALLIDRAIIAVGAALGTLGASALAVAGGTATLATSVRGLGVAMGIASGPIGLTVTAISGFAYWISQSAGAPFSSLVSSTNTLSTAMESLRDKTKGASDALLAQMRARGLASGSEASDAKLTMDLAKKQLEEAKVRQARGDEIAKVGGIMGAITNPIGAVKAAVSHVRGANQIAQAEQDIADAEVAYKKAKEYADLQAERADTLKMADQIAANATKPSLAVGTRALPAPTPTGAGGGGGAGRVDRTPMKEVDSARKLAEAEYDQAMAYVEFDKKVLDLRKNARLVGEQEYQQTLDALAELEISKGIKRESAIQQAINKAMPSVKDSAMREQLQGSLAESLQKEKTLMTKAYTDKALAQQKDQIQREKFLMAVEELEAESFDNRLTEQQRFIKEWDANNKELMDRAMVDGDMESFIKLSNIRERGKEKAAVSDRANASAEMPGASAIAISSVQDSYKELYERIQAYRDQGIASQEEYAQSMIAIETRMQQEIAAIYVEKAQERLDFGTGGWEDMMLVSLDRVTEGFTTFSSGASELMGEFFTSFTDGFANSIGRAIVYSEDLNGALKSVADEALAQMLSGLIKLGVQYMITEALGVKSATTTATAQIAATTATAAASTTAIATTTTASTAAAGTTASAWAPAAAFASIGSWGTAAALGLAGILAVLALTKGFKSGGYTGDGGISDVAGVVHGREFVVNAAATAKNRPMLEMMNAGAMAGAFDKGGTIPGGKWGLVGEFGPEIVQGPAQVTSREKTAELLRTSSQERAAPAAAPVVNLKNINVLDPKIVGDYLSSAAGEKVLMNTIQKNRKALA